MTAKRTPIVALGAGVVALLVVGLIELAGSPTSPPGAPLKLTLAQMRASLAGSPEPLAELHAQAGELLSGGASRLDARLASLRGRAVVINKWASWCEPCRAEFAAFQRVSLSQGRQVAFIGIDSGDSSRADAVAFLRSFPVSYPSYYDKSGGLGAALTDSTFTPVTVFYDRHGAQFIHQGPYLNEVQLERDVRRYALDA
ncbi:MAG TPA: TlpA disulfide reductase family protein [Solirubrobacteraceae bacterium]|jgi:thiol-disulfide isomerase/thioredoxin|nr:TlpA disulfide reductase family protein [Solirubrobacteraceae bacterium]